MAIQTPVQLLAVMPKEWLKSLTAALGTAPVAISTADDWQSALLTLKANPEIEVVLSASVLPDATWQGVLAGVYRLPRPPRVLVAARFADPSLWYDVLEEGAYDLAVYPFSLNTLSNTIVLAAADCQFERDVSDRAAGRVQGAETEAPVEVQGLELGNERAR